MHFQGAIGAEIVQEEVDDEDEEGGGAITMNILSSIRRNKNVHFFYSFFKLCTSTNFWNAKASSYEGETSAEMEDALIKETFLSEASAPSLFTNDEMILLGR